MVDDAAVADPVEVWLSASLSPSRAGDFMNCPLLFRFRMIDRLPEEPSPVAVRGSVIHAVLERLFDIPAANRDLPAALSLIDSAWTSVVESDPLLVEAFADDLDGKLAAEWLSGSSDLLSTYFALEDPGRIEPAEREIYLETDLDTGLRLRGYVDRLDVAPDGSVRIVDYKTGRSPHEAFEAKAMFQMRFYALIWWRRHGIVPRLLQLMYLGNGEVVRYEPDEADLRATERKLLALWQAIEKAAITSDFRPSPSRLCEWCSHQSRCPAFGGTPPTLPTPIQIGPPVEPTTAHLG